MSGSHKTVVNLTLPKNVVKPFLNKPVSNQINGNTSDDRQFYHMKNMDKKARPKTANVIKLNAYSIKLNIILIIQKIRIMFLFVLKFLVDTGGGYSIIQLKFKGM